MRIIVIGGGAIGRTHADTIVATPGFELAGIVDPYPGGAALAAEHGVPSYGALSEALATGDIDGAIVATPNELHVPVALELVAAGVPMIVEKPVAGSIAEAERLVAAAEAAGVPVLVGHHRRHHPAVVSAKRIIDSGRLGRLTVANVSYFLMKPDDYFDIAWHGTPGTGGAFLINLIHEIDLLRHLVGEIVAVTAIASSSARGLDVEDTGAIGFLFDGGAVGSLAISDIAAGPWSWDLSAGESGRFAVHAVESHRIAGTHGALTLPDVQVWTHDGPRDWFTPLVPEQEDVVAGDPYAGQLRNLRDAAEGTAEPLVSAREGLRNLVVLEAIRTAAETGVTVRV